MPNTQRSHSSAAYVGEPVTLRELLSAFDLGLAELVDAPVGDAVMISSAALVESDDLSEEIDPNSPMPDLYLHVGVNARDAVRWLARVSRQRPEIRPKAVMSKAATKSSDLQTAARIAGVALIAVHPKARWDQVFPLIERILDRPHSHVTAPEDTLANPGDLFDLALDIAHHTGGIVSIEDAQSHVLAYSPTSDVADQVRTLSILERECPRDYLQTLQELDVFGRLRKYDDVIEVPAYDKLGIQPRLVIGIRRTSEDRSAPGALAGTIWVQRGNTPFAPEAPDVLRGAAVIAGRVISQILSAPSNEERLIQRLFAARGGGDDIATLASALNLPMTGPAAVIGFALTGSGATIPATEVPRLNTMLQLHASSFRHDSVAAIIGDRAYVLFPGYQSVSSVSAWTRQVVEQFEAKRSITLRAAIAIPIPSIAHAAQARQEVDRVLNATADAFPELRVTTLAQSRTAVLLGEILDLIAQQPSLRDPRLGALLDYDAKHASALCESAVAYLAAHGEVRSAAKTLQVHPNTLRYRLRRLEDIAGIDLTDAADRLLFELQLALLRQQGKVD
ncbi:PucR family transcriptional regulator [Hoyosella subflava]|uniref:Uncharacterized protein n=1 Tax=Hoyosella subflava (strain DSM 45089 / JCM 17490 / NBRC 109087 / DQS3-9A1) TaxID=443218 RepID=F6EJ02_HOYSD|nr:helix-turn-helix domain-containing protein [Hoyosella subflava]AEF41234.1 hypothetical protein AS9A_2787 [Hoyosella subflava DQS3-9A1]